MESFSTGDRNTRGFLRAVDSMFDSVKPAEENSTYDGTFRIIDQLIWTDLYAVLHVNRGCQSLKEFWSLAAEHPQAMYVGSTNGIKRKKWRKMRERLEALELAPQFEIGSTEL